MRAKLRLLREPFIPRNAADREESVADFVKRRLGREFLDYAINPLVAGVYAGDPERLSLKHAFPKLYDLEQRYGSLIKGQIFGARERKRRAEVSKQHARKLSFDEGLQVLPDTLARHLGDCIHTHSPVVRIEESHRQWRVNTLAAALPLDHSAIIYAGSPLCLPEIRTGGRAIDCSSLAQIHYPPIATLVLGFRRADVTHPLDGFGLLIPECERFRILGTVFSSSLFPNRAPAGYVLLTCYIGGCRDPKVASSDPGVLQKLALEDLRLLLGVSGKPTFVHHAYFRHAIPQYEVGYGRLKAIMAEAEQCAPGFFFAGNYRDGIALSDSIVSGHRAANRVSQYLVSSQSAAIAALDVSSALCP